MTCFRSYKTFIAFLLLVTAILKLQVWEDLDFLHRVAIFVETVTAYYLLFDHSVPIIKNGVILSLFFGFAGYQTGVLWWNSKCQCFGQLRIAQFFGLTLSISVILGSAIYIPWKTLNQRQIWILAIVLLIAFSSGLTMNKLSQTTASLETSISETFDSSNPFPIYFMLVRPGCAACEDKKATARMLADSSQLPLIVFAVDRFDECPECIAGKGLANAQVPAIGCWWNKGFMFFLSERAQEE